MGWKRVGVEREARRIGFKTQAVAVPAIANDLTGGNPVQPTLKTIQQLQVVNKLFPRAESPVQGMVRRLGRNHRLDVFDRSLFSHDDDHPPVGQNGQRQQDAKDGHSHEQFNGTGPTRPNPAAGTTKSRAKNTALPTLHRHPPETLDGNVCWGAMVTKGKYRKQA
jgi:hypothetical protein